MGKKQRVQGFSVAHFAQALLQPSNTSLDQQDIQPTSSNITYTSPSFSPTSQLQQNASVRRTPVEGPESEDVQQPLSKKRKLDKQPGLLGPGYERVDASGLVPHYTDASEVPERLKKYFFQRNRYFSLYDKGCLLDEEGWYSVTPERIADQIAERCRCGTVLDAFCGVGGNAIAFAKTCERVIALDTSPTRLALARHNAAIYGVEDRIEFILADFLDFARSYLVPRSSQDNHHAEGNNPIGGGAHGKIDVVFLSPPWGGPEYLAGSSADETAETNNDIGLHPEFPLASVRPIHGADLFKLSRRITRNIAYYLPRNTNLSDISQLLEPPLKSVGSDKRQQEGVEGKNQKGEMIEIEEEWMGQKLKALTCYFGGLVQGQEYLFEE